jgi:hypothetical protein
MPEDHRIVASLQPIRIVTADSPDEAAAAIASEDLGVGAH